MDAQKGNRAAILHYSAPPVVGGVEAVIEAHARLLVEAGYEVAVIAGDGRQDGLPPGVDFRKIPAMGTQHPSVLELGSDLEQGVLPAGFEPVVAGIYRSLKSMLDPYDHIIVHNVFTKHFNLPLTAALTRLANEPSRANWIAWSHDFTWSSPASNAKVHPGYPWDLLKTHHPRLTYVVVSKSRQAELAKLLGTPEDGIRVIYNGIKLSELLGLSEEGLALINRMELLDSEMILLMPVRVTKAKNIEFAFRVIAALKEMGGTGKLVITGPPDPHDPRNLEYYRTLLDLRQELRIEKEVRFVYESGPDPQCPYTIELPIVGELYRVADLLFMASLREGFGIPVLEAAMVGMPVFSTRIPASLEVGGDDLVLFDAGDPPEVVARRIYDWGEASPTHKLRRRVRQQYTWRKIFEQEIQPLLQGEKEMNQDAQEYRCS